MSFRDNENVKIDNNHADLVYALVTCLKPKNIIEYGLGGGRSLDAILRGVEYNANGAKVKVVDNWMDWGYKCPEEVHEIYKDKVEIVTSDEEAHVFSDHETYDFIFSDADHFKTQNWFTHVYKRLLNDGGILIYHDVTNRDFPNLNKIVQKAEENKLNYKVFNKSSKEGERCERGLIVIFK